MCMYAALTRYLDINAAPRRAMLVALAEMATSQGVFTCICIHMAEMSFVYIFVYVYICIHMAEMSFV